MSSPQEDDPNLHEYEEPAFLSPDEAIEVEELNEDHEPMDEDDDDLDNDLNIDEVDDRNPQTTSDNVAPPPDTSNFQIYTHQGPIFAIDAYFHSQPQQQTPTLSILSGGGDDQAFLHKIVPQSNNTLSQQLLKPQRKDSVACVAFNYKHVSDDLNATPTLAAVGDYEGTVDIYQPETGELLYSLEGPTDVEWICFHPKGGTVLLAGSAADGTIWMFHLPTRKCLQVFVGHESAVNAGAFTPDGKLALSVSADGTLRVWAPKTGMCRHTFRFQSAAGIVCMGTNGGSDGQLVVCGTEDGYAYVCHYANKKQVATLRHFEPPTTIQEEEEMELPMTVEAVAFAPQGVNPNWCATGGADGCIRIWDLANQAACRQVCRIPKDEQDESASTEQAGVTRMQWHPTLPLIFASTTQGNVHLWDTRNGTLLSTWTGHSNIINDLCVSFLNSDKTALIVTGGEDNSVRVFEADLISILQAAEAKA